MKTRSSAKAGSGRADEGWAVITTLFAGFVLWGGIGWALDRWLHTSFLVVIGVLVGMVLGIYTVVARFGGLHDHVVTVAPVSQESPWVAHWDSRLISRSSDSTPGLAVPVQSATIHSAPTQAAPTQAAPTRRETECP